MFSVKLGFTSPPVPSRGMRTSVHAGAPDALCTFWFVGHQRVRREREWKRIEIFLIILALREGDQIVPRIDKFDLEYKLRFRCLFLARVAYVVFRRGYEAQQRYTVSNSALWVCV